MYIMRHTHAWTTSQTEDHRQRHHHQAPGEASVWGWGKKYSGRECREAALGPVPPGTQAHDCCRLWGNAVTPANISSL